MTAAQFRQKQGLPPPGADRRARLRRTAAFDLTLLILAGTAIAGKPQAEHRFHPVRRWRLDYAWPAQRVAVEYEGIVTRKGKSRHATLLGYTEDISKYNHAQLLGWIVLRCTALSDAGDICAVLIDALTLRTQGAPPCGTSAEHV